MSIFEAVIFGIVEGITEFLPISSTGHLIVASSLLKIPSTEFVKTFEIVIQLGAILAVVFLYWRRLLVNVEVFKRVALAFIPTAVIGLALHSVFKQLLGSTSVVIWSLLVGGIALVIFEQWQKNRRYVHTEIAQMPYKTAIIIGLFQSIAIIPGVSRAAATIVGGLIMGVSREAIVEFSFLLAVPTMLAASGLDLLKTTIDFSGGEVAALSVGFVTAFIVALFVVKFFLNFIKHHTFTGFGVYRIAAALLFLLII